MGPRRKENAGGAGARGVRQLEEILLKGKEDVGNGEGKEAECGIRPQPRGKASHLVSVLVSGGRCQGEGDEREERGGLLVVGSGSGQLGEIPLEVLEQSGDVVLQRRGEGRGGGGRRGGSRGRGGGPCRLRGRWAARQGPLPCGSFGAEEVECARPGGGTASSSGRCCRSGRVGEAAARCHTARRG